MARFIFLSLRLRLSASPFAIVVVLELANPLHVSFSPEANDAATDLESLRRLHFSLREPPFESNGVHIDSLSDLVC